MSFFVIFSSSTIDRASNILSLITSSDARDRRAYSCLSAACVRECDTYVYSNVNLTVQSTITYAHGQIYFSRVAKKLYRNVP